jgi:adenylate cyclase class 2
MYEVELKVRADHDPVRNRLGDLGAERLPAVRQEDTYYDAPHRDFAVTDEALRVRRESVQDADSTTYLTYKGPLVDDDSKTRREAETAVADGSALARVLSSLGFEPAATVEKHRRRYRLDGYTVTLDAVDGLGEFVEVEVEVELEDRAADGTDGDLGAARQGAADVLDSLGLDPEAGIRTSYLGMLLEGDVQG